METFIDSLLERMLATSVQMALLVAVVWLLCRLVRRLSPATQCWLWWLVALQVLLGLCVDPVRLPWLPQTPAVPLVSSVAENPLPADGAMAMSSAAGYSPSWQAGVFLLWMSGLAVMCWSTLRDWRRARALLKDSVPCPDDSAWRDPGNAAAHRPGVVPRLRISDRIDSPVIVGHLRPVLLLPAQASLSSEELEMAVAHELEHLRRNDLWLGLVPALARHCFFFHPLMHLAVREYGIAREAACDAAVVDAGQRSRRDYGQLLLRLGTAAQSSSALAVASPTFHALSRRLTLLQHTSFLPRAGSIAVLILAVAGVMPLRLVAAVTRPVAVAAVAPAGAADEVLPPVVTDEREVLSPVREERVRKTQRKAGLVRVAAAPAQVERAGAAARELSPDQPLEPGQSVADSRPRVVYRPDIADFYPEASIALGEEGMVKLRLCYDEQGKVIESAIVESSGFGRLDEAASRYGRLIRLKPAVVGGMPLSSCLILPVLFSAKVQEPGASQAARYTGGRMTVNFQDIPVRTLLRLIGETSGRNFMIDDSVSGTATLRRDNVPWDELLDIVLASKGLHKSVQDNVIFITAADAAVGEQEARSPAR